MFGNGAMIWKVRTVFFAVAAGSASPVSAGRLTAAATSRAAAATISVFALPEVKRIRERSRPGERWTDAQRSGRRSTWGCGERHS